MMTKKDLEKVEQFIERYKKLPKDAELNYLIMFGNPTKKDKNKATEILDEIDSLFVDIVAFANIKFGSPNEYTKICNSIDFNLEFGDFNITTNNKSLINQAWRNGIQRLKNLLDNLKAEVKEVLDSHSNEIINQKETIMTMNNEIERLKALADKIQAAKLGQRGKEAHVNSYIVIDEYQEWRTETEDLFEKYYDTSNSKYQQFISFGRGGNGHTLMSHFDQQYPIFKVLIKKIELGEVKIIIEKMPSDEVVKNMEDKTVFISHSVKDKEIIDSFVDIILHGALSVPINKIFSVSTDGAKINSGADWRDSIKESLLSAKVNFLIITPNYKESEVCLNEMGASWVTSATVIPLIIDPINYKTVGVIQEPNQIEKLMDEQSLDRIKDIVQKKLAIPTDLIKSDRWTAKKIEFLNRVRKHLSISTFDVPIDRNAFYGLIKDKENLEKTISNLIEEKIELENQIKDLVKIKDKEAVEQVFKKHKPSSDYKEFIEVVEKSRKQLLKFSPIMRGIIFKEFTRKDIIINWENYRDDIDHALAEDFVTDGLDADWETAPEMQNIYESLNELTEILGRNLTESFTESFNQDYKAPLKIANKSFWENVFKVAVIF